jgi:hypothetical protein
MEPNKLPIKGLLLYFNSWISFCKSPSLVKKEKEATRSNGNLPAKSTSPMLLSSSKLLVFGSLKRHFKQMPISLWSNLFLQITQQLGKKK